MSLELIIKYESSHETLPSINEEELDRVEENYTRIPLRASLSAPSNECVSNLAHIDRSEELRHGVPLQGLHVYRPPGATPCKQHPSRKCE